MYLAEQNRLDEQMNSYKQDIETNLEKRIAEVAKVKEEIKAIEKNNEELQRLLEEERKKMMWLFQFPLFDL